MNTRRKRAIITAVALFGLGVFPYANRAANQAGHESLMPDCGSMALYNLLNLTGHQTSIEEVLAALPQAGGDGRSLLELKQTASRLGLEIEGRLIEDRRIAPTAPWIAFIDKQEHGHFLVVRPIGHTGRLIQILDGLAPPAVLDAADFFSGPEWTGMVLIPKSRGWSGWMIFASVSAAAGMLVVSRFIRLFPSRAS